MPTLGVIVVHPVVTDASGHRYQFTPKHHGGDSGAAMWLPQLTLDEEFGIFNTADRLQIADSRGWLYGVLRNPDGDLTTIGTWDEQVAEFPDPSPSTEPWHGYPQWVVDETGPANRRKQQCCPERMVFNRMVEAGLINRLQRKRLLTGRSA
jgi:hypothetical protein